jgi:hypothetical protein
MSATSQQKRKRENGDRIGDKHDEGEDEGAENETTLHVCPFAQPRTGFPICNELGDGRKSIKAVLHSQRLNN